MPWMAHLLPRFRPHACLASHTKDYVPVSKPEMRNKVLQKKVRPSYGFPFKMFQFTPVTERHYTKEIALSHVRLSPKGELLCAYSTETGHSVHGKLDSRSVATRGLFFTPDLRV